MQQKALRIIVILIWVRVSLTEEDPPERNMEYGQGKIDDITHNSSGVCSQGCQGQHMVNNIESILKMIYKFKTTGPRLSELKCNHTRCAPPFGYMHLYKSGDYIRGSCYKFYKKYIKELPVTKKICGKINGSLVSVETEEEMKHLKTVITRNKLFVKDWRISYWSGYWTSGMRLPNGTMIWEATGREITYFKWGIAQPDKLVGQDYIFISNSFFWFDMEKSKEQAPLCEQDALC